MQNILFTSCKMIQFTCYIICSVSDNLIGELFYIVLEEKILSVEVIALFSANPFPYENEPYLNEFRSYTPQFRGSQHTAIWWWSKDKSVANQSIFHSHIGSRNMKPSNKHIEFSFSKAIHSAGSAILDISTTLKLCFCRCIKVLGKEKSAKLGRSQELKTWGTTELELAVLAKWIRWVFEISKNHRHHGRRLSLSYWQAVESSQLDTQAILPASVVVQCFT